MELGRIPAWTKDQLVGHLRELGVEPGMVFMPHTSYRAIKPVEGGPDTVIDAMLEVLGPEGTLVIPTFSFNYCKTGKWDRKHSPSEMGVITEVFRLREGVTRNLHPIYSVAAYGKYAEEFGACDDEDGGGPGSALRLAVDLNALVAVVGVGYNQGMTICQAITTRVGVPHRFSKVFPGDVTDDGEPRPGNYSMLVRDVDQGVVTDIRKAMYMLEQLEKMKVGRFGWAVARAIRAQTVEEYLTKWIKEEVPQLLHRVRPDCVDDDPEPEEWTLKS